jgi:hypothetical protein
MLIAFQCDLALVTHGKDMGSRRGCHRLIEAKSAPNEARDGKDMGETAARIWVKSQKQRYGFGALQSHAAAQDLEQTGPNVTANGYPRSPYSQVT